MTYKTTREAMIQYEINHLMNNDLRFTDVNWWQWELEYDRVKALAEVLKVNTRVKEVSLGNTGIDSKGAIALAEALKVNTSVEWLELHWNDIRDEGAIALAEALKVNKTLKFLDLWSCSICRAGAVALAEVLKVNDTIRISMRDNLIEPKLYKFFNN